MRINGSKRKSKIFSLKLSFFFSFEKIELENLSMLFLNLDGKRIINRKLFYVAKVSKGSIIFYLE